MVTATKGATARSLPHDVAANIVRTVMDELKKNPGSAAAARDIGRAFSQASSSPMFLSKDDEAKEEERLRAALGNRILKLRESLAMKQAELARRARITQSYVWHVEKGGREPSLIVSRRIARALGVKLSELFAPLDSN